MFDPMMIFILKKENEKKQNIITLPHLTGEKH